MRKKITLFVMAVLTSPWVFAQTGDEAVTSTNDFMTKVLAILNGPLMKVVGAIILFVGAAGLLQGKYKIAFACGAAFVILLFFPWLISVVGGTHQ